MAKYSCKSFLHDLGLLVSQRASVTDGRTDRQANGRQPSRSLLKSTTVG